MKEKRLAREVAMQILFQWEAQGQLLRHHTTQPENLGHLDIESFVSHFWELFYGKEHQRLDRVFASSLVRNTVNSIARIDTLIEHTSTKWKLSRMDAIDRAILRLACCELAINKKLAPAIIINEAVELAKRYGNEQSPQFINGLLDNINSSF
jgi:N utilization substance protein B